MAGRMAGEGPNHPALDVVGAGCLSLRVGLL